MSIILGSSTELNDWIRQWTLFSLFVSDLMDRTRDKTEGISLNRTTVHGMMFADDVVLVAETQEKLQALFDELSMYCKDWK